MSFGEEDNDPESPYEHRYFVNEIKDMEITIKLDQTEPVFNG
jgi:hypothetical protein